MRRHRFSLTTSSYWLVRGNQWIENKHVLLIVSHQLGFSNGMMMINWSEQNLSFYFARMNVSTNKSERLARKHFVFLSKKPPWEIGNIYVLLNYQVSSTYPINLCIHYIKSLIQLFANIIAYSNNYYALFYIQQVIILCLYQIPRVKKLSKTFPIWSNNNSNK